jgi:hypothetical protein
MRMLRGLLRMLLRLLRLLRCGMLLRGMLKPISYVI